MFFCRSPDNHPPTSSVLMWWAKNENRSIYCYYHPQRSWGKVFTRVCDSVHTGDVCPSACWDTPPTLPHWADTPRADLPQADTTLGRPPSGRHPQADTPPGQTPPQCMLGYGQQAGGKHPTGMQSCSIFNLQLPTSARTTTMTTTTPTTTTITQILVSALYWFPFNISMFLFIP